MRVYGWDIGGANVKVARAVDGRLDDVRQWPCRLWEGVDRLEQVFDDAREQWDGELAGSDAAHAVTMTGEMADAFEDRQTGVAALVGAAGKRLGPNLCFFAGDAGWRGLEAAVRDWRRLASANWLATGRFLASRLEHAVLVDIGSTTTDFVPIVGGQVAASGRDDAVRLATGELVYHGVIRTPLCALGPHVMFRGRQVNVMNEFFATAADVYRLTGELAPAHDVHLPADGRDKSADATRQRLARMVGCDAGDADAAAWSALARHWRNAQLKELERNLRTVIDAVYLPDDAPLVAAGCGAFLVPELARRLKRPWLEFVTVARVAGPAANWAGVCAASVSVALLASRSTRRLFLGVRQLA